MAHARWKEARGVRCCWAPLAVPAQAVSETGVQCLATPFLTQRPPPPGAGQVLPSQVCFSIGKRHQLSEGQELHTARSPGEDLRALSTHPYGR